MRAPRYRQKLAPVPFNLNAPEWVDDESFAIERHLYWAPGPLPGLVDEVMSMPLRRDRPLWEMWICQEPEDNRFALIGKAHHCMVDGIAAVELGSLLLDTSPEARLAARRSPGARSPSPAASGCWCAGCGTCWRPRRALLRAPVRVATSPARAARSVAGGAARVTRAVGHSLLSGAPSSALNRSLSPLRRLAWAERPLEDLSRIKQAYGTTINDVMLAAVAGGMRTYLAEHGEEPVALKAMVPVSVRSDDDVLGNHISFVFAELPCDIPDPLSRLYRVHDTMSSRKQHREPEGADLALKAAQLGPGIVQSAFSRVIASPRTYNLVVSNIPGPAGADVHARLPAGIRLPGRAPVGSPPRLDRHDDRLPARLLRRLRRPRGATRRTHAGPRHRRGDQRAAGLHLSGRRGRRSAHRAGRCRLAGRRAPGGWA